jgi:hypothetical protein
MTATVQRFKSACATPKRVTVTEKIRQILGEFCEDMPVMMIVDGSQVRVVLINYDEASPAMAFKLDAIGEYCDNNGIRVVAVVMPRAVEKDDEEIIDDIATLDFLNTYRPVG